MSEENPEKWERDVLEKVLLATVHEQRKARYWGIVFKSLFLAYLVGALFWAMGPVSSWTHASDSNHTAVVDVAGMIADGAEASADNIIDGLRSAVEDKGTKGIILRMNTPGGSPVQSAYVYEEIRKIKQEHPQLPIYAVVSDLCASGGYYIASAADKIYVSPLSLIGSIGVIMNGFGFVDAIGKVGVERRLMTAGEHKAMMDPFVPVNLPEKEHIQGVLNSVHQQFILAVKQGRGDRLKEHPDMFSGLVWSGSEGIALGLADEIGDARSVAEQVIGAKDMVDFTPREHLLDRVVHKLGASFALTLESALTFPALR